jgi:hypothetical protein
MTDSANTLPFLIRISAWLLATSTEGEGGFFQFRQPNVGIAT